MSFPKAERFKDVKPCGPPPTAYDVKHPTGTSAISFPKGDRFQAVTPNNHALLEPITRSCSSSSVGSTESGVSKSHGKVKDHVQCNKKIADLEKELRNVTMERNQLLRRRNHPINTAIGKDEEKENQPLSEITPDDPVVLTKTIQELQSKLDVAKTLEEEMRNLEDERDNALADLELKQSEISRLNDQLDSLKTSFKQEEEALRSQLDDSLLKAREEKERAEATVADLNLKLENLENVRVELVKEVDAVKEQHEKDLSTLRDQHKEEIESLQASHGELVKQLENNMQQLVAEHDAESEQAKFDFARQVEELNQNHATEVERRVAEHSALLDQVRSEYQSEIHRLQTAHNELASEKINLLKKLEEASITIETKSDEVETLKAQHEVALEVCRTQFEEKYENMKRSLELDIAECQKKFEEQRRTEQDELRRHYETELSTLDQSNLRLTEMLHKCQIQLEEVEKSHEAAISQHEIQLKRLNDNNHTEKEILMWQMNQQRENLEQELRTDFNHRLMEKEAEIQKLLEECENKLAAIREDHKKECASLRTLHSDELTKYRESHEAMVEGLEREKTLIVQERLAVELQLEEKEAAFDVYKAEMSFETSKLKLELDMLRESNNELVADLLKVEQERQLTEAQMETEKVEIKEKAEEEKRGLLKHHETVIASMEAANSLKDGRISDLVNQLSAAEETSRCLLLEKDAQLEDLKAAHQKDLEGLKLENQNEINELHLRYEKVFQEKDLRFTTELEQVMAAHYHEMEKCKEQSKAGTEKLQEEFRVAFAALERELMMEKEQLIESHTQEMAECNRKFEENLASINQHHQSLVEELNVKYASALQKTQELEQSLDVFRMEFQESISASEAREAQHRSELEVMASTVQSKEEELRRLQESVHRREKQMADEWIQRETALMSQFSAQNQQTVADFESRLEAVQEDLKLARETAQKMRAERDAARDDISVLQVQMEAQIAGINEQHEVERAMILERLSTQSKEIESANNAKISSLQSQLSETLRKMEEIQQESDQRLDQMAHGQEERIQLAVQSALEPLEGELESLRKDRESLLLLQKEYQELLARIEPFREQLDMFEAEKKALLSQAMNAESSMASLASKYTQLLGHTNSKQKIHHLEKLKQDIFNLRKELADKNLALEKEKKARQKADARIKELTGLKKYDPSEAFKVPETPVSATVANKTTVKHSASRPSVSSAKEEPSKQEAAPQRKPLRPPTNGFGQSTGFFVSMDDVEKTRTQMEEERQRRIEMRRQASTNFEAFEVDLGGVNARRETFDVPNPKMNVTHNLDNKENSRGFPQDISCISIAEEVVTQKSKKASSPNLTSTPLTQRFIEKK